MPNLFRLVFVFVFMGWGQFAFAAAYEWVLSTGDNVVYSSPGAACSAFWASVPSSAEWTKAVIRASDTTFHCQAKQSSGGNAPSPSVYRSGDSCPADQQYVSSTGSCGCPAGFQPDTLTGACIVPPSDCKSKLGERQNINSGSFSFEMCFSGCSFAADDARPFKRTVSADVEFYVSGQYTGEKCSGATPDFSPAEGPPPPTESTQDKACTATQTDAEGRQTSSCTTTDTTKNNQACVSAGGSLGSFQGVQTCVAKGKGPAASSTSTKTTVTTTPKPAPAGPTTTTNKTVTTTTCIGKGACTTTTTTSTTNNHTNSDGTSAGSSTSCKGANCSPDGTIGDGTKPSEGEGDGEEGEEEGEGIPGPTAVLGPKDSDGFGDALGEWDQKILDARSELDSQIAQYSALFEGVFDLNMGSGTGALPCYQIPLPIFSTTLDFCPADYDDQLIYLRYILLLCAAVAAGFIVLRN